MDGSLEIELYQPWSFVYEFKEKVGVGPLDPDTKNTPKGRIPVELVFKLPLVDNVGTFFKENPDIGQVAGRLVISIYSTKHP